LIFIYINTYINLIMPATKRTLEECYENELDLLVEIMNAKKKEEKYQEKIIYY
jgi:hypothetical protein